MTNRARWGTLVWMAVALGLSAPRLPAAVEPLFVEAATATGLTFTHANGATGQYYMAEQMGAGVALFDYDNDGDLDVLLLQGGTLDEAGGRANARPGNRLFRNDLQAG